MSKKHSDKPIITHLTDTDFYKFTMGYFAYRLYQMIQVIYGFKNRTKSVRLGNHVDIGRLREELEHLRTLRFTSSELFFLGEQKRSNGNPLFPDMYLDFMYKKFRMPEFHLEKTPDNDYDLTFGHDSFWPHSMMGETLVLSIMTELYGRDLTKHMTDMEYEGVLNEGRRRRDEKIKLLQQHSNVTFMEFATRRRFSRDWQYETVEEMAKRLPGQIVGTSNVYLAMKLGIPVKGTMAHELFMVLAALASVLGDKELLASHNEVLQLWESLYGPDLLIALTDTFGSDFFFRDMTARQAASWKGFRQDSGDPIEFGEKQLQFYERVKVDPHTKLLVPSDGLDVDKMINIADHFQGRIPFQAGWGTTSSNDLGFKTLSMVVKAISANGVGTVKLSDNLAKAMGSPENIERYTRVFGYTRNDYVECRV